MGSGTSLRSRQGQQYKSGHAADGPSLNLSSGTRSVLSASTRKVSLRQKRASSETHVSVVTAASKRVQAILDKETAVLYNAWTRFETQLAHCIPSRPDGTSSLVWANLSNASSAKDSTKLALAIRAAERSGVLQISSLQQDLEVLLAAEELEVTWRCLASALENLDRFMLKFWLDEAAERHLDIPHEVLAAFEFLTSRDRAQPNAVLAPRAERNLQQLEFNARVDEAHRKNDEDMLLRLAEESQCFGACPESALAALATLGLTKGDDRKGARQDLELNAIQNFGRRWLEAELEQCRQVENANSELNEFAEFVQISRKKAKDGNSNAKNPTRPIPKSAVRVGPSGDSKAHQEPATHPGQDAPSRERSSFSQPFQEHAHSNCVHPARQFADSMGKGEYFDMSHSGTGDATSQSQGESSAGRAKSGLGSTDNKGESADGTGTRFSAGSQKVHTEQDAALICLDLPLGCAKNVKDIRAAFKRAALRWHPDRPHNHGHEDEAKGRFLEARAAMELLLVDAA